LTRYNASHFQDNLFSFSLFLFCAMRAAPGLLLALKALDENAPTFPWIPFPRKIAA